MPTALDSLVEHLPDVLRLFMQRVKRGASLAKLLIRDRDIASSVLEAGNIGREAFGHTMRGEHCIHVGEGLGADSGRVSIDRCSCCGLRLVVRLIGQLLSRRQVNVQRGQTATDLCDVAAVADQCGVKLQVCFCDLAVEALDRCCMNCVRHDLSVPLFDFQDQHPPAPDD